MRLTVLGSAGSAPGPDSPCSGYLIEHDGYRLLLDLGPGAVMTLQRFVAPGEIDAAILSHAHSDPGCCWPRHAARMPTGRCAGT